MDVLEYRQQRIQKIFKKDIAAVRNFLTCDNILKLGIRPTNGIVARDLRVSKDRTLNAASGSGVLRLTCHLTRKNDSWYKMSINPKTFQVVALTFKINTYVVAERLQDSHECDIMTIDGINSSLNYTRTTLELTTSNMREYNLDKELFTLIKEKKFNNLLINSLLENYKTTYKVIERVNGNINTISTMDNYNSFSVGCK